MEKYRDYIKDYKHCHKCKIICLNEECINHWIYTQNLEIECPKCKEKMIYCDADSEQRTIEGAYFCLCCGFNIKKDLSAVTLQKTVTDIPAKSKSGKYFSKNICIHCGKEFQCLRSDAKYCSTRCRVAATRAKNKPGNEIRNKAIKRALWKVYETPHTHPTYIENGYWEIIKALENPEQYIKKLDEKNKD